MRCPFCGHEDNRVLDTRMQRDGSSIRRRRECLKCQGRFTTVESHVLNYPFVIKKDGRREPFDKTKIMKGIQLACQKRPISLAVLESVVEKVAKWTMTRSEKEVQSAQIGQKVMSELKNLDDVAYVRFASVYRSFKDLSEFVQVLDNDEESESENILDA